jgi:hypothetical protein
MHGGLLLTLMLCTLCSDLSPFYLEEARSNMRYWKSLRSADVDMGGIDGTGTSFLQVEGRQRERLRVC